MTPKQKNALAAGTMLRSISSTRAQINFVYFSILRTPYSPQATSVVTKHSELQLLLKSIQESTLRAEVLIRELYNCKPIGGMSNETS